MSVPLAVSRGLCSIRILGRRDVASEAPGNSDRGWSGESAGRRARDACRGGLLNVVVLDLA